MVNNQYQNANFGTSPLARIQPPEPQAQGPGQGGPRTKKPPAGPTINAVRITGYWRDNPRSANVVSDLVNGLRERGEMFRFTTSDGKGKTTPLDEKQIITEVRTVVLAEGDLAYRFQIVLPLAREITLP